MQRRTIAAQPARLPSTNTGQRSQAPAPTTRCPNSVLLQLLPPLPGRDPELPRHFKTCPAISPTSPHPSPALDGTLPTPRHQTCLPPVLATQPPADPHSPLVHE